MYPPIMPMTILQKGTYHSKNDSDSAVDYKYNLGRFSAIGPTTKAYRTSPTENLVQLADKSVVNADRVDVID